ncbi:uncharacterized protein LOC135109355 [Scylla paramamosain]|uniref:uncharacterized protein LOC135109355 n=1 Tax=Scylla paramamosain TaxID=85552 RepID=UPI0030838860
MTTMRLSRRLSYHLTSGAPKTHVTQVHKTALTRKYLEEQTEIITICKDNRRLPILEALHIKNLEPKLNIQNQDLQALWRPDFPTCYTHNGNGSLDLILSNRQSLPFHHHISHRPLSGSDHVPLILKISSNHISITSSPVPDCRSADWERFKETLSDLHRLTQLEGQPDTEIDSAQETLHNDILTSANRHTPKKQHKIHIDFRASIRTQRLLFWHMVHKLKGCQRERFEYLLVNGDRVTNNFQTHWRNTFQPHPFPLHEPSIAHIHHITDLVAHAYSAESPRPLRNHLADGAEPPPEIISSLTKIFNACLASGYFPKALKTSNITLITKPGKNSHLPENYRPISLLEILGKTFEHLINLMRAFLEDNGLLAPQQFSFRRNASTEDTLNSIVAYLNFNKPYYKTALVAKDVKKAFDTAGVPQGSVLSPTLFNMYTADLPSPPIHNDSLIRRRCNAFGPCQVALDSLASSLSRVRPRGFGCVDSVRGCGCVGLGLLGWWRTLRLPPDEDLVSLSTLT